MTRARSLMLGLFAFAASLAAADSPAAVATLLNGRNLDGWELITTPTATLGDVCHLRPDGVLAIDGKPPGFLQTARAYADYRLHLEWRWPGAPGNSGVLVHISSGPKDRVWPVCFQVQTKTKAVGDLLPMAGATFAEPLAPGSKTPIRYGIQPLPRRLAIHR